MILLGSVITILGTVLMAWIHPWCAVLFFVFTALLITIYSWEIKKRRDKLQQLNTYLSLICAGKYDLDIADNEEGEISILKNNLYKVIVFASFAECDVRKGQGVSGRCSCEYFASVKNAAYVYDGNDRTA